MSHKVIQEEFVLNRFSNGALEEEEAKIQNGLGVVARSCNPSSFRG